MARLLPLVLAAAVVATLALDPFDSRAAGPPAIAPGTRVAGVDVGGLPETAAAARLHAALRPALRRTVEVRAAGHRLHLSARRARVRFDAAASAQRALAAASGAAVVPVVRYDERRVEAFVARVARTVNRRPRSARLRYTVTRLKLVRARSGRRIDRRALRARVERALVDPAAPRVLRAQVKRTAPRLTTAELRDRRRTVVTIHRRGFRLRLFKDLRQVASYRVAVGMPGHATPRGRFTIANKAIDPAWSAPDEPWAGAYRNEVVPGGSAENPLKARWLGIVNGVGIHGTAATWSLGSRASHGCIRMAVPAVKRLYARVPVGALVMIK